MERNTIIAIVLAIAIGAAAVLLPPWLRERAKAEAVGRCEGLRTQRRLLAARTGADPERLATLDAEISLCAADLAAQGIEVDDSGYMIGACEDRQLAIEAEWVHYRSTAYEDAIKRNNTRQTILRQGETMIGCYRDALDALPDSAMAAYVTSIDKAITSSKARASCFAAGAPGCSRYGLNEPHGNDRAHDEAVRVMEPLEALRATAEERRARSATTLVGMSDVLSQSTRIMVTF